MYKLAVVNLVGFAQTKGYEPLNDGGVWWVVILWVEAAVLGALVAAQTGGGEMNQGGW